MYKARYTLATKLNSTRSILLKIGNKVYCCRYFVAGLGNKVTATPWIRQFFLWSTLLPVCTGPKQHGRLRRLSTKLTVLNSTLLPVCTGLKRLQKYMYMGQKCQINDSMLKQRWQNLTAVSFCLLSPLIIDIWSRRRILWNSHSLSPCTMLKLQDKPDLLVGFRFFFYRILCVCVILL